MRAVAVALDTRVVPSDERHSAERSCKIQEHAELDEIVAGHARIGRTPRQVLAAEIVDDRSAERRLEVDDIMRYTGHGGGVFRIFVRGRTAALADLLAQASGAWTPEPHGNTDRFDPSADGKRRRDGTIDAPAHGSKTQADRAWQAVDGYLERFAVGYHKLLYFTLGRTVHRRTNPGPFQFLGTAPRSSTLFEHRFAPVVAFRTVPHGHPEGSFAQRRKRQGFMSDTRIQDIGQQLASARERHGLLPCDVADRLRIRAMFVNALERQEWAVIGEFVYVRGFLKNYAKLVGLDPAPLVAQLAEEYAPEVAAPRPALDSLAGAGLSSVRTEEEPTSRHWFPWMLGALTTIAAALVVMVGISLVQTLTAGNRVVPVATPLALATTSWATPQPAVALSDGQNDGQTQNEGVNLRLQLTQPSWLSVAVDGKRVVYETLPAGTIREFHGVREITLRAGNAGGVVAKIDGKDLGTLGHSGQVQDRIFAVKPPSEQQLKTLHE